MQCFKRLIFNEKEIFYFSGAPRRDCDHQYPINGIPIVTTVCILLITNNLQIHFLFIPWFFNFSLWHTMIRTVLFDGISLCRIIGKNRQKANWTQKLHCFPFSLLVTIAEKSSWNLCLIPQNQYFRCFFNLHVFKVHKFHYFSRLEWNKTCFCSFPLLTFCIGKNWIGDCNCFLREWENLRRFSLRPKNDLWNRSVCESLR